MAGMGPTAANGVDAIGFLAADEAATAVTASLSASRTPPIDERARQERWLVEFFFNGLSTLECLHYGAYFLGAMAAPLKFSSAVDRRRVTPKHVVAAYAAGYATTPLAATLGSVVTDPTYAEWRDIRHFLSHRGSAGRTAYQGGADSGRVDWNLPITGVNTATILEPAELRSRREWLGSRVSDIATAALAFVTAEIP